jgi:hypothetical protein
LDIDISILDLLGKSNNVGVVFRSSQTEATLSLLELVIEVFNQFFDGFDELVDWSLDHGVELYHMEEGGSVLGLL